MSSPYVPLLLFAAVGCGATGNFDADGGTDSGTDAARNDGPTVLEQIPTNCSTEVVRGLSIQIAEEIACSSSEVLTPFAEEPGINFESAAVLPYLSEAAIDDLRSALETHGGLIRITSGFRTVAQQYLLHQWFLAGRCGIAIAATPGTSNHESGRALDIANFGEWSSLLPNFGWAQTVPGDDVHFDHTPSPDNRGLDVLAFQRLWNRNFPGDAIAEDGDYGPQTQARLEQSPAEGFAIGPQCQSAAWLGTPLPSVAAEPESCRHLSAAN